MFNCYRKFIPNFATLADPIVELTRGKMKKYSEVKWDQKHDECLSVLKDKLSTAPILKYPDFTKEFALEQTLLKLVWEPCLLKNTRLKVRSTLCLCCSLAGLPKEPREDIASLI